MHSTSLTLLLATPVFILAGSVKGVTGMGLPTVAMGLLSLFMPPPEAAALLVIPSTVTNLWQFFTGRHRLPLVRRLWPMLVTSCAMTWAAAGLIAGEAGTLATAALGAALLTYALVSLGAVHVSVPPRHEAWLSLLAGTMTGFIAGATAVFVIPAVPYLQALGFGQEELVQALGLSFTVSTVALAIGLAGRGVLHIEAAGLSTLCVLPALLGMGAGQALRTRVRPATFRRLFLIGLLFLGADLIIRALI